MKAAPSMLMPVALAALKFRAGDNRSTVFIPKECSWLGPMQHAWHPVSANVLNVAVRLLVAGGGRAPGTL